ncbi:uncharacterized protein LY79DRAFT_541662 [Colletotrichum navitas]|uniref:Uncharacterized protein n=1 Tax=Colletotrichum navitas TaxID=681940 RepID=A0AAD8VA20_9PEZI|nr:uncharacterized protein LY79DRAFT_541662 [Colletotrichum navitas]KAK1597441.1 hypothetical protein LY79DRAFT_541662 [Colletotrichum navitas]
MNERTRIVPVTERYVLYMSRATTLKWQLAWVHSCQYPPRVVAKPTHPGRSSGVGWPERDKIVDGDPDCAFVFLGALRPLPLLRSRRRRARSCVSRVPRGNALTRLLGRRKGSEARTDVEGGLCRVPSRQASWRPNIVSKVHVFIRCTDTLERV